MIGLKKPNFNGKFFLLAGLVFILTWLILILIQSSLYLSSMLNPPCSPAPAPPPGFVVTDIPFQAETLTGWWTPPKNEAVILLLGGHGANQAALSQEAQFLAQAGYGVLTTNYRHCLGQSVSFGWQEIDEFNAVYARAQSLEPLAQIGVLGFSAGAVTAIRGAAAQPDIKALIIIGNYASLKEEIITPHQPLFSLRWQIERSVYLLYWLRTGLSPQAVNILPELENIQFRPVLLIHGEYEQQYNQADLQLQAAGPNAVLWIAPDSDHGTYLSNVPDLYRETVINFFQHNLP